MSLQTIVSSSLTGRLHLHQAPVRATIEPRPSTLAVAVSGGSMRILEMGIALTALGTALLIGLGR